MQEKVGAGKNAVPRYVRVVLEDDLVNACKPGDEISVIGIVKRRWNSLGKAVDGRTDVSIVIHANHVKVINNGGPQRAVLVNEDDERDFGTFWRFYKHRPLDGRDRILASFCPQIYGLYAVKIALAVALCGGVERQDDGETRVRGQPHVLLVGDPGTGKSQLLRYASKLAPRSVLTTGIGSSSAGLTVAASRESGEWHLEAGALVLADGGICCIDEFNSIRENDRACIHEAMEQQTLSVAKAGMVCKLQTRCSVLAATNPKGAYDATLAMTTNTAIASPLLSRFDLVFVLLDTRNRVWDENVADYILRGRTEETENAPKDASLWSMEKLQNYFSYCKTFTPNLSEEAAEILRRYYQRQRRADDEVMNMARTTVRLLQSAIRLAQGHARLMCRSTVEVMDAVVAVTLLEASNDDSTTLSISASTRNPLHSAFPEDPMAIYAESAKTILEQLNLHNVWVEEERRLIKDASVKETVVIQARDSEDAIKAPNMDPVLTQALHKRKAELGLPPTEQLGTKRRRCRVDDAKGRLLKRDSKNIETAVSSTPKEKAPKSDMSFEDFNSAKLSEKTLNFLHSFAVDQIENQKAPFEDDAGKATFEDPDEPVVEFD